MMDTVEGMSVLADDENQKSAAGNGIELPQGYVPTDDEPFMNQLQLAYFRKKLLDWKEDFHREAKETLAQLQKEPLQEADATDRASRKKSRAGHGLTCIL